MVHRYHHLFLEDMNDIYMTRNSWHEFDDATIYITGANGMLASYLVYYLIWLREDKGINLRIVINVRNEKKTQKLYGDYIGLDWFLVISNDICEVDYGTNEFPNVDYIIHAASYANAKYFGTYPVETILPNVIGLNRILEYCRLQDVKGVVYLSSTAVYGLENNRTLLDEQQVSILDLNSNGNFYGISKYCGEALCRAYALEYDIRVMSVRIAHSYGPTMDTKSDVRVFSEFVEDIIRERDIVIKSNGKASRFFCYESDCISGILTVLLDGQSGESYNLGNPTEKYTITELATVLSSLDVAKNSQVKYENREMNNYTPPTCSAECMIDISKLEDLGWKCQVSVKDGFERTIKILKNID